MAIREELADTIKKKSQDLAEELVKIRRRIHRKPELGFEEKASAQLICNQLDRLGVSYQSGVASTGVVGVIEGSGPGPTVGLRADMDAVPVQEETNAPYASRIPGVMHACGHDAHVACLLGAIMLLTDLKDQFYGRVKFIFQPAEEIDLGAKAVIADGGLDDPRPDAFFALHCNPDIPAGFIGLRTGPVMAAIDTIKIAVIGRGGHGAMPHKCTDAIVAASALVMNLQTVVSRIIDPLKPTVVSIGTFSAGRAGNIIASQADLTGTVRCVDPEVHKLLPQIIKNICEKTSDSFGAEVGLEYQPMVPPLVNSPEMVTKVSQSCQALLQPDKVVDVPLSMGGDDFSFFLNEIPGAYFHLGVSSPDRTTAGLHNCLFDIDERCLPLGAAVMAHTALLTLGDSTQQYLGSQD